ncbi:MAG TPA: hypothetical protein ENH59_02305 [Bacteroidetes bacterium]|nr:hypothetical protein [Bacteroidota bacterium]
MQKNYIRFLIHFLHDNMKKYALLLLAISFFACGLAQDPDVVSGETLKPGELQNYLDNPVIRAKYNNDPYDNERAVKLDGKMPCVSGEILNPGQACVEKLQSRTVMVKEFFPARVNSAPEFRGAFQYTGYSLSDIVKDYVVSKYNKSEFGLNTDVFVVVENDRGDKAVFSWGELFYTQDNHDIILATHVRPVFPSASDDKWPLPEKIRLIASNDYITVRNIDRPSKIIIRSFPESFPGSKGLRPLFSPTIEIKGQGAKTTIINAAETGRDIIISHDLVFFGMHKGLKGPCNYTGVPLSGVLKQKFKFSNTDLARGMIAIGAKDAYRVVFTLSEILNRTDMAEVLLLDEPDNEDGRFIVHPGADFFADRHLKGAKLAYILLVE